MRRRIGLTWRYLCLVPWVSAGCSKAPHAMRMEAQDPAIGQLHWLTGSWISVEGDARSEEHWIAPAGGSMLGVNRTVEGGKAVFFEYLRIENTPEGIVYTAQPMGRSPGTPFKLVEPSSTREMRAVFENPDHDFPQRIVYWRDSAGALHGRIEGRQDDKPTYREWTWWRASPTAY